MEQAIIKRLGIEKAFDEITRALTSDQKEGIYEFIANSWEIDVSEITKHRD